MRFQKFAFSFHWKRNESIASTRSFSYRFARPHGNDENDWKRFQPSIKLHRSEIPIIIKTIRYLSTSPDWDYITNRFQKFTTPILWAFSLISTRPLDTDTVAFSNLSTLESVFKSFRFHRKRHIVFVLTGHENATNCLGFQVKTHSCGRGLSIQIIFNIVFYVQHCKQTLGNATP